MDEAEKYQQRLQAIAEKRRLQEEQERVKREMEEERIRLQQLKRKSLRDQWLMEGPPASPDSSGPRSPLWGQQAQEIEQKIDSLQAKTDQLTEEVTKLTEDDGSVNDGQTPVNSAGVHVLEDGRTEDSSSKGPVLQNGQGNGTTEVGAEDDMKETLVAPVMAEVKGPNGEVATDVPAALQAETGQSPSTEQQGHIRGTAEEAVAMATSALLSQTAAVAGAQDSKPVSNGLASKPGNGNGAVTLTFLGFSDPEKGEGDGIGVGVGVGMDDDGGAIMRAERVIIVEEEEETEEEPKSQTEASEGPAAPQTSTGDPDNQELEEATEAEAQPSAQAPAEEDTQAGLTEPEPAGPQAEVAEEENKAEDGETPSEAHVVPEVVPEVIEATAVAVVTAAAEVHPQPQPTEGTDVTSEVPVYTPAVQTAPNSTATGEDESLQPETSGLKSEEEGVEATPVAAPEPGPEPAPDPVVGPAIVPVPSSPCRFEDVPLDESINMAPKALSDLTRQQAEHEPLLDSKTVHPTDASAPQRAEVGDAPKRKTCQCCSIM